MIEYERFPGVSFQTAHTIYEMAADALSKRFEGEKLLPVANTEYKAASALLAHIDGRISTLYQERRDYTRGESRAIETKTESGETIRKTAKKTSLKVGSCLVSVVTID